MFEVLTT